MVSMNKKDLVTLIEKMAQSLADPPGVDMKTYQPTTPTAAPAPASGGAASVRYRNPTIVKMQEALQALAQAVTSQLNVQKLQGAEGRDSFGDFFAKHYLQNKDVSSVEFSPDPTKTKMPDKDPRSPSKLNWVMDTMRRIGGEKAEGFADGVWGPRTNASLVNSYALAEGLLNLSKEFKLPVHAYSESDLAKLKPAINEENGLSSKEKNDVAPIVIGHLNAIRRLYNEIKQGILEKPQWRAYIENDKPYVNYKSQALTPQQLEAIKQTYPQGFNIPVDDKGTAAKIEVDNLISTDTLNKWIAQFPETKLDPYNVLKLVSNQISKGA
jgi:hypothetical protein